MERDLAGAALSAQEFQRLAKACHRDTKFPKTYAEWQSLVATGTKELLAQGQSVEVVPLTVDDFLPWCQRMQIIPCLDALRAYMILRQRLARNGDKAGRPAGGSAGGKESADGGQEASRSGPRHPARMFPWVQNTDAGGLSEGAC
jgi:hypothetical protein